MEDGFNFLFRSLKELGYADWVGDVSSTIMPDEFRHVRMHLWWSKFRRKTIRFRHGGSFDFIFRISTAFPRQNGWFKPVVLVNRCLWVDCVHWLLNEVGVVFALQSGFVVLRVPIQTSVHEEGN